MSVLQRKELEDSPLADLHAIASELGIEGYRGLRRQDLVASILDVQGGERDTDGRDAPSSEPQGEVEDVAAPEQLDGEADEEPEPKAKTRTRTRKAKAKAEEPEPPAEDEDQHEPVAGVLDVLPNGSGFLRREDGPDVYISPAQIRRCELRPGDEVAGPARPPRRNERHPSLVRVGTVNGREPEPPETRPDFAELTPVHASERLAAPSVLADVPFGKGSRVAIAGPSGAGATRLLREIVSTLTSQSGDLTVTVVLAGARPEEVTDWRGDAGASVSGGSFDSAPEQQAQAAQLAVDRAKRVAERGGDAVVVVDSLEGLEPGLARRLFAAARNLDQAGSLTIIAAVGDGGELLRLASTRIVLEGGTGEPEVAAEGSGAQRPDLLG